MTRFLILAAVLLAGSPASAANFSLANEGHALTLAQFNGSIPVFLTRARSATHFPGTVWAETSNPGPFPDAGSSLFLSAWFRMPPGKAGGTIFAADYAGGGSAAIVSLTPQVKSAEGFWNTQVRVQLTTGHGSVDLCTFPISLPDNLFHHIMLSVDIGQIPITAQYVRDGLIFDFQQNGNVGECLNKTLITQWSEAVDWRSVIAWRLGGGHSFPVLQGDLAEVYIDTTRFHWLKDLAAIGAFRTPAGAARGLGLACLRPEGSLPTMCHRGSPNYFIEGPSVTGSAGYVLQEFGQGTLLPTLVDPCATQFLGSGCY